MAVPSYAYLNLKMLGPRGVITITGNFWDGYKCQREAIEQTNSTLSPEEARLDIEKKTKMSSATT